MDKDIFNRFSIEIIQETDMCTRVSRYVISNGKIISMSSEYHEENINLKTSINIDYDSGKISDFDKSDYKIKNS
jgi:hypothetical protein